MKFFDALACLFLACLVGQIFMTLGTDGRAAAWPATLSVVYVFIVGCSFPFWFFTFAPIYLITDSKSLFWRWHIAPIVGGVIGLISELILFEPTQYDFYDFPRQYLAPPVIGFVTFLLGATLKRLSGINAKA